MNKIFIAILVFLLAGPAVAEDWEMARLFARQGIVGTMVISSLYNSKTFIHNTPRANQRFATASTFKIINTLISLEEKAVSGKDDVLKWDGQRYDFPDWNRDQTLESAFKVSCVWCYQALARRVGADKYRDYLHRSVYGELHEPFDETTFWLDGSLQISAVEQVSFLKRLYLHTLPFSASTYETLRQIMLAEQTPDFSLWAKTGWATRLKPQVGWYVGYVETPKDVWFFATNIEVRDEKDLPLRQKLTRKALQMKGIIQ
ncbi:MAG: class D beta-lactamase [Methylococcales bacterium]|nr:class D beta-lactamase [Methylococcales bacterium]